MTAMGTRVALAIAAVLAVLALLVAVGGHQATVGRDAGGWPGIAAAPAGSLLHLVTGSRWVNGIYTDYPRSQAGAVSAAVEFMTALGSTLDPDRAATVARLAADPSYHAAAADAAASAISARRVLGLPPSGPLPEGTAAFLVPVMYQLLGGQPHLGVLLLFDYTVTAPSGVAEHIGVTEVRLTWTQASWRLLPPPAHDLAALLATPGTASATAKGWEAMTYGL